MDGLRHHPHTDGPLEAIGHVHGGAPALDIGGDIGALAVLLDPAAAGTELHLRADGVAATSVHTGVWTRHQGTAPVTAALFAALTDGTYWVLDDEGADVVAVEVTGGEVVTLDLRLNAARASRHRRGPRPDE